MIDAEDETERTSIYVYICMYQIGRGDRKCAFPVPMFATIRAAAPISLPFSRPRVPRELSEDSMFASLTIHKRIHY